MNQSQIKSNFNEHDVIHNLKHFLPAQAPLKDFVHHNTLHAFQDLNFKDGIQKASEMFGYKVYLSLDIFREYYKTGRISQQILSSVIQKHKGTNEVENWKNLMLKHDYDLSLKPRIGNLRSNWKNQYHINLDSLVHPLLFRVLCSYLDQGISIWNFPVHRKGFFSSIREIEKNTYKSFFKKGRARNMLLKGHLEISELLRILVGNESLYEQYLFDQQFSHQGWSGMVSAIEDQPETLLNSKKINLKELILFELLLEIDALDSKLGENWSPLSFQLKKKPINLFSEVKSNEPNDVLYLWQEAFEWTYYDEVLVAIKSNLTQMETKGTKNFQSLFCIDDRESSLRHYIEATDPNCETFGTPGFFGVEFFFQPEHGKFYTKLCPAPVTPKYLIKETGTSGKNNKDVHLSKRSHSLLSGWLISQTLGFWSAFRLLLTIFRPTISAATSSSFRHMDKFSNLSIEYSENSVPENNLQIGFKTDEMAERVKNVLKSIGLTDNFSPLVYVVGHGSSSVNNPHYAAYDCGACSGRPGSVNARVFCYMANHPEVRKLLAKEDILIPESTKFVGALHDTTRDEIIFFDENSLSNEQLELHKKNEAVFAKSLEFNAKERSRRFESIDTKKSLSNIHEQVKRRSVSLFEPRPELNHATNALCIVGRRQLSKSIFLDRRSFFNSYNYAKDPSGNYLLQILRAAAPVCGGINLEYYFSRVDNHRLGAGTKLPHNVMGLFGVANGIDGDLRPGLPSQMIEVHDPLRLLIVVEHFPEVILNTLKQSAETFEWFINNWIHLVCVNPDSGDFYEFREGEFNRYTPLSKAPETLNNLNSVIEKSSENLPVYLLN